MRWYRYCWWTIHARLHTSTEQYRVVHSLHVMSLSQSNCLLSSLFLSLADSQISNFVSSFISGRSYNYMFRGVSCKFVKLSNQPDQNIVIFFSKVEYVFMFWVVFSWWRIDTCTKKHVYLKYNTCLIINIFFYYLSKQCLWSDCILSLTLIPWYKSSEPNKTFIYNTYQHILLKLY